MNATTGSFPPAKHLGLATHGAIIAVLAACSGWGFWQLFRAEVGLMFVVYLLVGVLAFAPIPVLGYRAYALYRALYRLDRDSLEIRWGLRHEVIPLADIEWVRSVQDLAHPLASPRLALPGALLGVRRHRDMQTVEFIASRRRGLLLVGTPRRVYAISPASAAEFLDTFARAVELGSLREAKPRSVFPSLVFSHAWHSGAVRYLWLAALFLNIGLAAWISLLIPSSPTFALGFRPDRAADAVPSGQLVILPLVSAFLSLSGWITGLFFYRWARRRAISLVLWASVALSSLFFVIAVLFIVTTPV